MRSQTGKSKLPNDHTSPYSVFAALVRADGYDAEELIRSPTSEPTACKNDIPERPQKRNAESSPAPQPTKQPRIDTTFHSKNQLIKNYPQSEKTAQLQSAVPSCSKTPPTVKAVYNPVSSGKSMREETLTQKPVFNQPEPSQLAQSTVPKPPKLGEGMRKLPYSAGAPSSVAVNVAQPPVRPANSVSVNGSFLFLFPIGILNQSRTSRQCKILKVAYQLQPRG